LFSQIYNSMTVNLLSFITLDNSEKSESPLLYDMIIS